MGWSKTWFEGLLISLVKHVKCDKKIGGQMFRWVQTVGSANSLYPGERLTLFL
jgi:hypothetical protein